MPNVTTSTEAWYLLAWGMIVACLLYVAFSCALESLRRKRNYQAHIMQAVEWDRDRNVTILTPQAKMIYDYEDESDPSYQ